MILPRGRDDIRRTRISLHHHYGSDLLNDAERIFLGKAPDIFLGQIKITGINAGDFVWKEGIRNISLVSIILRGADQ
jgi:hypothetical protein